VPILSAHFRSPCRVQFGPPRQKIPGYAADDGGDADVRQDTVRFRRRLAAAYGRFGERLALARQLSAVRATSNETATDAD